MPVKVLLPMYNVERWVETTFKSLQDQDYKHFEAVFLDDCSSDSTVEKLRTLIGGDERFSINENPIRLYSMGNLWNNVSKFISDEDFVVIIDGDDWFFNSSVLGKIVSKFEEGYNFIHGQFIEVPKMLLVDERSYSEDIITNKSFRRDRWRCTGIRAFRGKLWKNIGLEDVSTNGKFYQFAADLAYTFPLLESSEGKIYRFDEPIHIYNKMNPLNDDKLSRQKQIEAELKIRNISLNHLAEIMKNDNLRLRKII